jgi:threonine dehydrogenase-like Zn-dependent dehydrogenase
MSEVVVVIGPGLIGQAIARRVGVAKHVLPADMRPENAEAAADTLGNAGYERSTATVDASSRDAVQSLVEQATSQGEVSRLIHAAGVSPSQASAKKVLEVDLYGTSLVLGEFGNVIASGGSGVVVASQSGHRSGAPRGAEPSTGHDARRATAGPPLPGQVEDSLHAYQLAKRCNSFAGDG